MTTREPSRWQSSQPDRPCGERSLDVLLDALLEGGPLPDGEPAQWQPVAQVLIALTSAPERCELTGEAQVLAEFRARRPGRPARLPRGVPRWVTPFRGARPAVAASAGAVLAGGLLAAAYAGDLPAPAQRLAHDMIHAPAARPAAITDPDSGSRQASPLGTRAGRASSPSAHAAPRPGRPVPGGSSSGHPHQPGGSSSASGTTGGSPSGRHGLYHSGPGRPVQSGSPSSSPTPGAAKQSSSLATTAPVAGATPSPSATPSATGPSGRQHQPGPASTQSTPP